MAKRRRKIDNDSSLDIPIDIVEEILHRLPAKSVAKFVGVSKSWANIIHSKYFINSFMEFQRKQPHRLLFTFNKLCDVNWRFFSSSSSSSPPPVAEYISSMDSKVDNYSCSPIYVKGLLNFMFGTTHIITNPSTGNSIVLPYVKSKREILILNRHFGFDPIKAEYKVLCIIKCGHGNYRSSRIRFSEYQVLTLGSNSKSCCLWRKIESWMPHHVPFSNGICIDGIIYYLATIEWKVILVRFDVSSEKFLDQLQCSFLQQHTFTMIKYKSKLAIGHEISEDAIELWVLEDGEKPEWLKITHDVSQWRSLINGYNFEILGTIPSGEIVYTCYSGKHTSYVIYQDEKKNQHRIVKIKEDKDCSNSTTSFSFVQVHGFIDYVESVMLL